MLSPCVNLRATSFKMTRPGGFIAPHYLIKKMVNNYTELMIKCHLLHDLTRPAACMHCVNLRRLMRMFVGFSSEMEMPSLWGSLWQLLSVTVNSPNTLHHMLCSLQQYVPTAFTQSHQESWIISVEKESSIWKRQINANFYTLDPPSSLLWTHMATCLQRYGLTHTRSHTNS